MTETEITDVDAWEVLDSRGNPTVRVAVEAGEERGVFTVPSGASTGRFEAVERRDGGDRFDGLGVREAVRAVTEDLAPVVVGRDVTDQGAIDGAMVAADGTDSLENYGANAVLGVSGAVARAGSAVRDVPLYEYFGDGDGQLPRPMVNVLSGGLHAEGGIEVQDFLAVPLGGSSYSDALEMVWEVRTAVHDRIVQSGHRPLVADEGGFSPPLETVTDGFELLVEGIRDAGYRPGTDLAIALDVAATHFYEESTEEYVLESMDRRLDRDALIETIVEWTTEYPIVSIEDPLAEDDWTGWAELADRLEREAPGVQLLGDDLLVTNVDRLRRSIVEDAATAVLVKPNQAGTISRALSVIGTAKAADVDTVVSARSGETCDTTIADLAVGTDVGQIKIGSLARSERLAKYNRLLEIAREDDTELANPFADWTWRES